MVRGGRHGGAGFAHSSTQIIALIIFRCEIYRPSPDILCRLAHGVLFQQDNEAALLLQQRDWSAVGFISSYKYFEVALFSLIV